MPSAGAGTGDVRVTQRSRKSARQPLASKPWSAPSPVPVLAAGRVPPRPPAARRDLTPASGRRRRQPAAVRHQQMAEAAEARLHTQAFAVKPCIGVRGRGVGLVASALATEVAAGTTTGGRRPPPWSVGPKFLVDARTWMSVRPMRKCTLGRCTSGRPGGCIRNHAASSSARSRSWSLGPSPNNSRKSRGSAPDLDAETDEPAEYEVAVEPLHQLPLRSDRTWHPRRELT